MNKRRKLLCLLLAGSMVTGAGLVYAKETGTLRTPEAASMVSADEEAGLKTRTAAAGQEPADVAGGEEAGQAMAGALAAMEDAIAAGAEALSTGDEISVAEITEHEVPVAASEYTDIAIAQVNNYVNVRALPNTESEILGKLYNNSAATILETTEDGWYRIQSGTVNGYVKAEYVVAGDEELARAVSTRYATVTTTTLFVRSEPTTESAVLTMLPEGDDLEVLDESVDGWVKVSTVEGEGYVSADYVSLSTEYVEAESKEEEEARLAKEEAERKAAAEAARKAREEAERKAAEAAREEAARKAAQNKGNNQSSGNSGSSTANKAPSGNVSNGQAVVDYARQFLGNPYVYGGTSLTNGADCSGFVQSVYKAFGVSLPRNSAAQRGAGYAVSLDQIQPGDLVCYSGHIGIYAGNNTLIHASNEKTGITLTSPITYRKILAVRRIF